MTQWRKLKQMTKLRRGQHIERELAERPPRLLIIQTVAKRGVANLLIDAGKVLSMRPYKTASKRSSLVNMGTSDGQARVDGSAKLKTATGTS